MYPKELPIAIHAPNRKLAELSVEMDLEAKTLDDVIDILDAYDFNPIMGLMVGNLREDRRIFEVFIDETEATISLEEVSEMLRRVSGVFNVEYNRGIQDEIAVCQLHYPPKTLGEEAVIFRLSVLKSWFKRLWDVYGSGAGRIFYDAGVEAGKNAVNFFMEKLGLKAEMLARFMVAVGSSFGWGRFTLEEFDMEKCRLKIRAENSFECKIFGKVGETRGYFMRGYILGAAIKLFKTENLTVEETKCIAKGDPCCEFEINREKST